MKGLLNYLITITLVVISGSIFFVEYLYPVGYIVVFLLFLLLNLFIKGRKFLYYDVLLIMLFVVLNLITIIVTNDKDFYSYIGFIVAIGISFLASRILTKKAFVSTFSKVMTVLSLVSVLCFVFGLLYPDFIVQNLPKIKGLADVDYYNAFIHVYQYSEPASLMFNRVYIDPRNASIFWEPGVFQAFINLNIYFILNNKDQFKKHRVVVVLINIVALISTLSITGYFILFYILINYFRKTYNDRKFFLYSAYMAVAAILLGLFSLGYLDFFISRVLDYGKDFNELFKNVLKRTYLQNIEVYKERINQILFGLGFSHPRSGNANSIIELFITHGLILSSIMIVYLKYKLKVNFKHLTLFIVFILIFITEPLLQKPFFLYFLFLREDI